MPSEMIYSRNQDIDVRVAWGREDSETVQVATLVKRQPDYDPTQRVINIVNEWLEAAGETYRIDLDALKRKMQGRDVAVPYFDGYHATLDDWGSANALIRVLKRARDQAFGRPE